jgi:cobalamin biosynthesis protein CobT
MPVRSRVIAVISALVFVAAVASCDSSDDDSTADEEGALSKSEFVKQADQVCADANESGELVVDERLVGRVDDLVPPEPEQDTVTQLLDQWRDYFDQPSEATAAAADDLARELSLDECVIAG